MKETIQVLKISFDVEKMDFDVVVTKVGYNSGSLLTHFREMIDCHTIDIVTVNENLCIIVDDNGLLTSGLPVIEIQLEGGQTFQLAGKIIFTGNQFTDEGCDVDSLSVDDCRNLVRSMKVKAIGITK